MSPNFRASAGKRLQLLAALLLLATLCAALSAHFWFFELFSHFRPYYAVFGVLCVIGLGATRAWRWAAVAMLLALWNGYPIVRL